MTSAISSYAWNPLLSPSYSNWAAIANNAGSLSRNGLPAQSMASLSSASLDSALLSATGSSSPMPAIDTALTLNPAQYNATYNAYQTLMQDENGNALSTQDFLAQFQQYTNPLLPTGNSDTTTLITQAQNSKLEDAAPAYYLNTFNPYSYLTPPSGQPSSMINLLT